MLPVHREIHSPGDSHLHQIHPLRGAPHAQRPAPRARAPRRRPRARRRHAAALRLHGEVVLVGHVVRACDLVHDVRASVRRFGYYLLTDLSDKHDG